MFRISIETLLIGLSIRLSAINHWQNKTAAQETYISVKYDGDTYNISIFLEFEKSTIALLIIPHK